MIRIINLGPDQIRQRPDGASQNRQRRIAVGAGRRGAKNMGRLREGGVLDVQRLIRAVNERVEAARL